MPEQETIERARQDAREGKSPSTQAGEFVREEIHHIREGKHGAASTKQAIAIALSKARKAGVDLPPAPGRRRTKSAASRRRKPTAKSSKRRAAASLRRLKRKGHAAASHAALSRHAKAVARKRRRRSA